MRPKRWWLIFVLLIIAGTLWYGMARRAWIVKRHIAIPQVAYSAGVYDDHAGHRLPYRLLAPARSSHAQRYPLVVILHGAGERGTDNRRQLRYVAPVFLQEKVRRRFPCYVLAPQCPPDLYWVNARYVGHRFVPNATPTWRVSAMLQLIKALQAQNPIDSTRIYLIGYSMGGSATWDLLMKHPTLFAAAVPMSGRGDTAQAGKIRNIPIWVFHGAKDNQVGVSWSRDMVFALHRAGGHPHYTEYPDSGHNCWERAIAEQQLLPWLFAQ